jgi:hypothetical protein
MMFQAMWLAIVIAHGNVSPLELTEREAFASREACEQHVSAHKARMPDFVRGHLNAPWDVEIEIDGTCVATGQGA